MRLLSQQVQPAVPAGWTSWLCSCHGSVPQPRPSAARASGPWRPWPEGWVRLPCLQVQPAVPAGWTSWLGQAVTTDQGRPRSHSPASAAWASGPGCRGQGYGYGCQHSREAGLAASRLLCMAGPGARGWWLAAGPAYHASGPRPGAGTRAGGVLARTPSGRSRPLGVLGEPARGPSTVVAAATAVLQAAGHTPQPDPAPRARPACGTGCGV